MWHGDSLRVIQTNGGHDVLWPFGILLPGRTHLVNSGVLRSVLLIRLTPHLAAHVVHLKSSKHSGVKREVLLEQGHIYK